MTSETPQPGAADPLAPEGLAEFVGRTREMVWLRECDRTIILRPNRIHRVNETAWEILRRLYDSERPLDPWATAREVAARFGEPEERVLRDAGGLGRTLLALLREDPIPIGYARTVAQGASRLEWPLLSEIALTYGCQNRCRFCYASSPDRETDVRRMAPDEVDLVIERIAGDAHCPTLSFTGGEPTLVRELPRHIRRAKALGLRVNLITNGVRCAEPGFAEGLAEAGLDSAQVSLEAADPELHDDIVAHPGAWERTVVGVRSLRAAGIHTHTNTTICGPNKGALLALTEFLARTLESEYFSLNIVIRTGASLGDPEMDIAYADLREIVPPVFDHARELGIKPVWYSPTPLCLFNPMVYGVGSTTCACCESLLSVNPAGEVLPCSSFGQGVGSILRSGFERVWRSPAARYWRSKAASPPGCAECDRYPVCYGACPLYWDATGSFDELEGKRPHSSGLVRARWRAGRATLGRAVGVGHE